ncbi:MAG: 50S ribosomal protein L25, partial [Phycisphaerales bacterium]|nr:50S ribosomal protein L25 [Phycisphaerales bacterium]
MSTQQIPQVAVALRDKLGSRYATRLRNTGRLPAVVYGHHQDPLHVSADAKQMLSVLHSHAHVIEVKVDDKIEPCLVKDVQWDHLGTTVIHVDLERVDLNETVTLDIDIKFVGEAVGLKEAGTILEHPLSTIEIQCLVTQIPEDIKVDVSALGVGDTLLVRDLKLPTGVKTTLDDET